MPFLKGLVFFLSLPVQVFVSLMGTLVWLLLLPLGWLFVPLSCAVDVALYVAWTPVHVFCYLFKPV